MSFRIYNTLSKKVELFSPIDSNDIRMYVCGPTVYNKAHLGNARPAIVFDTIYRILIYLYPKVTYVRNITDIDDKIYKAAMSKGISIFDLTDTTTKMYHEDMNALNVLEPDIEPRATDHIPEIIGFIEELLKSKHAYISNNHVYFDVSSYKDYGSLSGKNIEDLQTGYRIDVSENKKNPLDFVLWKPIDEEFNIGWESPFGVGRPGWHIECSAMSKKYLGESFDIHGGGLDLIFPHHENEIAQSCSNIMAKYWVHNGYLNINNTKMSKSLGNFFTVSDILKKYDGEVIRLAFLMTHYRAPLDFNESILLQAKNILDRWYNSIRKITIIEGFDTVSYDVFDALLDNLNTPLAISRMHTIVGDLNKEYNNEKANILVYTARNLLGLFKKSPEDWFGKQQDDVWIKDMIEERNIARKNKDYKKADEIREKLLQSNVLLEDTNEDTSWKKI